MKNKRLKTTKKAQLYGLSIFIYSIAIALVLIIGLVGLSRDITVYSHAGLQRHQSMSVVKNAETLSTLMSQERAYAVDRALFYTAAYGGHSTSDFLDGAEDSPCEVVEVSIPFLGEKELPYWYHKSKNCDIPDANKLENVFRIYADGFFVSPRAEVLQAVRSISNVGGFREYKLYMENFEENLEKGFIETRWAPSFGEGRITLNVPFNDPDIIYSTPIYSHLKQETRFYEIYEESKEFVENEDIFEEFLEGIVSECGIVDECCTAEINRNTAGELVVQSNDCSDDNFNDCIGIIISRLGTVHKIAGNIDHKYTALSFTLQSPEC